MGKKQLTLLYILLNILIVITLGLIDPELKSISQIFRNINLLWIIGAIGAMMLFWTMDALILDYAIGVIYEPKSFWNALKICMIGQYYNAVTPFASGGQPAQVYYMGKVGVPGGSASSVLMIKFLIYQVVLSIYCVISFIWKGMYIYKYTPIVFWFSVVGFIINAGAVVLLLSLSLNKKVVKKLVFKVLGFLNKIKLVRNLEGVTARLAAHVEDFHKGLTLIKGNAKAMLNMGYMTSVQLFCFFSITYFIYKSFGLNQAKLLNIIFVQALLYLAVSFIPTPGSTGASETGFMIFFQYFFSRDIIFISMLLWRLITYYLNILGGGIIILVDSIKALTVSQAHK